MGTTPSLALRRICPMGTMPGGMAFQSSARYRDAAEGLVERRRLVREEDFGACSRRGQHRQAHFQIRFAPTSAMGRLATIDHGLVQFADHGVAPRFTSGQWNLPLLLLAVDEEAICRLPNVALVATHDGQPIKGRMRRRSLI
jgi:hypothetical protein